MHHKHSPPIFRPKLWDCFKGYSGSLFAADLTAGVTVGIVALPLAMAFAIASGVNPAAGLFTAIIGGFIVSALGGSRVQIGGPTGAFVIIVYSILTEYGATNLAICTMMAGIILLVMGFARLGTMIKFIPYPVTMGFTSGIAVLIASTQVRDLLGLQVDNMPVDFLGKLHVLVQKLPTIHWSTAALGLGTVIFLLAWPKKWNKRVPGSIVALLAGTLAVAIFKYPTATIGTRFGGIPKGLPDFNLPLFTFGELGNLIQPALTIALLAAIESLLSAVVADGMLEDRHDSNQELIAQGLANLVVPLFGGIPVTGAIARTATNVRSGGKTPVAGIVHAGVLLLIVLVAAPLAAFIPLATLSAVLIVVAYRMGEWHHFVRLVRWPKSDAVVFLAAFSLTILVDLTVAVEVGMVLAAILFIKRVADNTQITPVDENSPMESVHCSLAGKEIPDDVLVFQIFGPFSFGVADRLETALIQARREPKVLILRMGRVLMMDATGLNALENLQEKLKHKGSHLILLAPHAQPLAMMRKGGFIARIGVINVCGDIDEGLTRARQLLRESRVEHLKTADVF